MRRLFVTVGAVAALFIAGLGVGALAATPGPQASGQVVGIDENPDYLWSLAARNGSLTGNDDSRLRLRLTGVDQRVARFAHRPSRDATHVRLDHFVSHWKKRFGSAHPTAVLTYQRTPGELPTQMALMLSRPRFDRASATVRFDADRIARTVETLPAPGRKLAKGKQQATNRAANPKRTGPLTLVIDDSGEVPEPPPSTDDNRPPVTPTSDNPAPGTIMPNFRRVELAATAEPRFGVTIDSFPKRVVSGQPFVIEGHTEGFSPGNWINVWVKDSDGNQLDAGGSIDTDDKRISNTTQLVGQGTVMVQLSAGVWPEEQWSDPVEIEVTAPPLSASAAAAYRDIRGTPVIKAIATELPFRESRTEQVVKFSFPTGQSYPKVVQPSLRGGPGDTWLYESKFVTGAADGTLNQAAPGSAVSFSTSRTCYRYVGLERPRPVEVPCPANKVVPDVMGKTATEARSILLGQGYSVSTWIPSWAGSCYVTSFRSPPPEVWSTSKVITDQIPRPNQPANDARDVYLRCDR